MNPLNLMTLLDNTSSSFNSFWTLHALQTHLFHKAISPFVSRAVASPATRFMAVNERVRGQKLREPMGGRVVTLSDLSPGRKVGRYTSEGTVIAPFVHVSRQEECAGH